MYKFVYLKIEHNFDKKISAYNNYNIQKIQFQQHGSKTYSIATSNDPRMLVV